VAGFCCVLWVAPQRIIVTDSVRIVANVVAGGFVAPRFGGCADFDTYASLQIFKPWLSTFWKTALSD
jgi:hypothetical protein